MRIRRLAVALAVAFCALAFTQAHADVLVHVDKSTQTMTVSVDGLERYTWKVSTGMDGYDTPAGEFKAFRMERDHFSREWDDAPMPYSIFFTQEGHAIHGSFDVKHLGRPASHGCVRLSKEHAALLWDLVKEQGLTNTRVELTGEIPEAAATGSIMREEPPLTYADDPPPRKHVRHRNGWREVDDGSTVYYYREAPRRHYRYSAPFPFGW